jgi:hypothetical protein
MRFFRSAMIIPVGFLPFAVLVVATGASFLFHPSAFAIIFLALFVLVLLVCCSQSCRASSCFPSHSSRASPRTTEKESKTTHGIENSRPAAPARTMRGKPALTSFDQHLSNFVYKKPSVVSTGTIAPCCGKCNAS